MKLMLPLLILLLAACSAPAATPGPTPPAVDQPVSSTPPPVEPEQPGDGGAQPVQPEPGIVDAHPVAWDHATVAADGRTVTIYFYGGVPECYGIAAADVQLNADGVLEVHILEGRRAALPPDTACIDIAVLKSVSVVLDQPLIQPAQ
jgi:hypothetical protein